MRVLVARFAVIAMAGAAGSCDFAEGRLDVCLVAGLGSKLELIGIVAKPVSQFHEVLEILPNRWQRFRACSHPAGMGVWKQFFHFQRMDLNDVCRLNDGVLVVGSNAFEHVGHCSQCFAHCNHAIHALLDDAGCSTMSERGSNGDR